MSKLNYIGFGFTLAGLLAVIVAILAESNHLPFMLIVFIGAKMYEYNPNNGATIGATPKT